jgi:uncharacterized membrane protein YkoI
VSIKQTITLLIRAVATAGVAAAVAACGGGQAPETAAPSSTTTEQSDADNQALLRAGETAQAAVADSTLVSMEIGGDNSRWEVQVVTVDGTDYRVDLSADGTKVTGGPSVKDEDAEEKEKHRSRAQAAKLDYRQALSAVTRAHPGRVTELNLDSYDGTTVWEADVLDSGNTKHEVRIDAASGHIVTEN